MIQRWAKKEERTRELVADNVLERKYKADQFQQKHEKAKLKLVLIDKEYE